jgi:branched-chain amino acid transport system permease protein
VSVTTPAPPGSVSERTEQPRVTLGALRSTLPAVAFLLAVIVAPQLLNAPYDRSLMIQIGIYSLLVIGFNVMVGYVGVVSFGHAAFFAIGAYAAAILGGEHGWVMLTAIAAGVVLAIVASVLVGLASLRIGGVYFALATLAFAELVRICLVNIDSLTNGPQGMIVAPGQELVPGVGIDGDIQIYWLVWTAVCLALYLVHRVMASSVGSTFLAVRENEPLAAAIGVHPLRAKLLALAIAGATASIAGACYAYFFGVVTPSVSGVNFSALALLMMIVGGRGTFWGPIVGALIFVLLPEWLGLEGTTNEIVFGAILLIVVIAMPSGVVPGAGALLRRMRLGRSRATEAGR